MEGQHWLAGAAVEMGVAEVSRCNGLDAEGLPLSARDEQVEQDRASAVLVHHAELAREAAGELCSDPQPDRGHEHGDGTDGRERADTTRYARGRKGTDEEVATIQIERDEFHGEWNYTISPHVS